MANFILRKFDDHLWARVKARAQAEGRTLRWLVLRLLELYADGKVQVDVKDGKPPPTPKR